MFCSFCGAPRSSAREQLVPEGSGGRAGLGEHPVLGHRVATGSLPASGEPACHRHGLPGQAAQHPPGFRLQQGTWPHGELTRERPAPPQPWTHLPEPRPSPSPLGHPHPQRTEQRDGGITAVSWVSRPLGVGMPKWSPPGASRGPGVHPEASLPAACTPTSPSLSREPMRAPRSQRTRVGAALGGRPISLSSGAGSAGEAFLSTIQKAAEVVASAMRPGPESPSTQRLLPRGDTYQPATMPSASHGPPPLGNPLPGAIPGPRAVRHQPGQAGGGWDELDSSPSSQNSSQNSDLSRVSDSGSHSGSDSHSGASREPGDLAERVEVVALSDCQQELSLVRTVTRGPRAFLSREEAQHFIKACGLLNCEAVLQLLTCHLRGTSECTQLRALCAIASLGSADLLPQEHILLRTRPRLQELSMGSPGPVTNKATKHSRDTGLYLFLEAPKLLCLNVPALVSWLTPTSSRKPSLTAHAVCHPWPSSCSAPEGRSGSIDLCALEHSELPGGCWNHTGRPLSATRPWHPPSACGHPQFLSSCFLPGCWKPRTSVTHPQVVLI
ncbi:PREDICTED: AP-4 complex accessory subunit tepsin isoform X4 [Cercocebus atys]|uniref:AP-4 complex accessory subunit tepsin isoform X4 n=1 Tax=Cercocebus atys TaxID=9531 RepID=UPI0005F3A352|nr:PREDICTED: AP-4 complex accessory subunit tepsin isoform X4 [Cercocebus atys]